MSTIVVSLMLTSCSGGEPEAPETTAPVTLPQPAEQPRTDAVEADFDAEAKYESTCAPCHGPEGRGDGPAGVALTPQPASFSDPAFWAERDDDLVRRAIKDGGASVGKSPIMAPFGNNFESDGQIDQLIVYLKTLESE